MEVEEQIEAYDWSMLDDLIEKHHYEQFTALDKGLIKNSKDWETLLHSTAIHDNEMIARYLLEMGVDVDFLNDDSETPLFIAVEQSSSEVVKVLLEANANIDIANADGISALQEVFDVELTSTTILHLMLERLRDNSSTMEELLERLMGLGCSMYFACFLKDRRVMELLLERGVSIDSRGYYDRTALYAAVELNEVNLAKWILDKGAEVNRFDEEAESPLYCAASRGKVDLVRLLLEHGADPNCADSGYDDADRTPLFAVFSHSWGSKNQQAYDECAELLLQHGAIPRNSSRIHEKTIFDHAMLNASDSDDRIFYLIGQLAILDILGKTNVESVMCSHNNDENVRHLLNAPLKKMFCVYELYKVLLMRKVYGKLSLLNLLTDNEDKMRVYARDRELVDLIHNVVSVELRDGCPYYVRLLKKRVSKAIETVKLEDKGIHVVSKLLHRNYNLCYNFGRKLVGYLNDQDLKQLCLV